MRRTRFAIASATVLVVQLAGAQTKITPPKNKYTPQQDVQLGREAAAEVRKQYPVVTNSALSGYLDRLGKRLVAAARRRCQLGRGVAAHRLTAA